MTDQKMTSPLPMPGIPISERSVPEPLTPTPKDMLHDTLSSLILRLDRSDAIFKARVDELSTTVRQLSERTKVLNLEVEEFKGVRESIKADLQTTFQVTLHKGITTIASPLSQGLSESFNKQTGAFIANHLEALKKIQNDVGFTVGRVTTMIDQQRRSKLMMGLSLVASVCFSCFIMGAGIFYFFPQHKTIHYEMTADKAKMMIYGELFSEVFDKFTPEDQALCSAAFQEKLKIRTAGIRGTVQGAHS